MVLGELRHLLTPAELRAFLAVYGGQQLRFAKSRAIPGRLAEVVGEPAARRLVERFHGEAPYIPLDAAEQRRRRDIEICARAAMGGAQDYREGREAVSETLERVAEIVGRPGLAGMCALWGGTRWYVAANPSAALVALVGDVLAAKLAAEFAGETLELPVVDVAAARRIEARRLRDEGQTLIAIAKVLGVSRATVLRDVAQE